MVDGALASLAWLADRSFFKMLCENFNEIASRVANWTMSASIARLLAMAGDSLSRNHVWLKYHALARGWVKMLQRSN
jgi:hypothetical protein